MFYFIAVTTNFVNGFLQQLLPLIAKKQVNVVRTIHVAARRVYKDNVLCGGQFGMGVADQRRSPG